MEVSARYPGWKILFLGVMCMNFGYSCLVSVTGVFLGPVSASLGTNIGDLAVYLTIQSIVAILVLAVVSKFYAEKTIKPIMLAAAICGIVGFIGFANATSVAMMYLWAVPMGFCFACLTTTPMQILVSNWYGPKLRGKNMGIVFGVNSLCVCAIIPILNWITQSFGWSIAYYTLAACLIVCLPLIWKLCIWSPEVLGLKRVGDLTEEEKKQAEGATGYAFKEGLKKPQVWMFFISGMLVVIASAAILSYTQPFMESAGFDSVFASSTVSIAIGVTVFTCIGIGKLIDKIGVHLVTVITGVAFALGFVVQLYIPEFGLPMVVAFVLGYGIGCPAVNVVTPVISDFLCGEKDAGAFMGYANMFISVGGALSATVVGQLVNATGGFTVPFYILAGILLLATIIRFVITLPQFKYRES